MFNNNLFTKSKEVCREKGNNSAFFGVPVLWGGSGGPDRA